MRKGNATVRIVRTSLLVIPFVTLFFLLAMRTQVLASSLMSNIAWVNLNKHLQQTSTASEKLEQAANEFQNAASSNRENQSAWFGRGLAYALRGDAELAQQSWKEGSILPDTLKEYGLTARRGGHLDAAIIFFRAADAFRNEPDSADYYLAGSICQRTFASSARLSESNSEFCSKILAENANNLILNSDFVIHDVHGWEGEHYFADKSKARMVVEGTASEPGAPYVRLVGSSEGNHFGLFQKLQLPTGSRIRFSGRFKAENHENLAARLLYIEWQRADGQSQGNHGARLGNDLEWTYLERTFAVPDDLASFIDFYPVVFSGQGSIWFDDIRLEFIND